MIILLTIVKEKVPGYYDNTSVPLICYVYKQSTWKYVLNYSQVCKDVTIVDNSPTS